MKEELISDDWKQAKQETARRGFMRFGRLTPQHNEEIVVSAVDPCAHQAQALA